MRITFFTIFVLLSSVSYSQKTIHGLPSFEKELVVSDLMIINIPNHMDGRFEQSMEIDELKSFITYHSNHKFELTIHIAGGASKFCLGYSEYLSKDLRCLLKLKNVEVIGNGNKSPIFLDKDSDLYFVLNSRIELRVVE